MGAQQVQRVLSIKAEPSLLTNRCRRGLPGCFHEVPSPLGILSTMLKQHDARKPACSGWGGQTLLQKQNSTEGQVAASWCQAHKPHQTASERTPK
jgi:hypothetical protein